MTRTDYARLVDALAGTWRNWGTLGQSLDAAGWAVATRCPGWNVAALFAHHAQFPVAMSAAPPPPPGDPAGEPLTAAELLRRFNAPGGLAAASGAAVAGQAVADADRSGHDRLVERFTVTAPAVVDGLRKADPDMVVPWPGADTGLRLAEALRIVLLEATVHLLDAQRALDREPSVPAEALQCTAGLLAELAPTVEFIEAATGRPGASPFPVLR